MDSRHDAVARARATYNAAADHYDDPANAFWDRFGRRTVERLSLERGARVLDVCCGAGASALASAELVGPRGRVLGVDLAEGLLERARAKSARLGLTNTEFRAGDMMALWEHAGAFDAVVCVFGVFFVPNPAAAIREMARTVRPGGVVAVTTWGPDLFEPANSAFWEAVRVVRPELHKGFNPWDSLCLPELLSAVFDRAGLGGAAIEAERGVHTIRPERDWWSIALGTGYRWTIEQLSPEERESVRLATLRALAGRETIDLQTNVLYGVARV